MHHERLGRAERCLSSGALELQASSLLEIRPLSGWLKVERGTVTRALAHEPFGHRPTTVLLRVRRYRCERCGGVWRQDTSAAAEPRAKVSRGGLTWALEALVVDHLTVTRVAAGLGISWSAANAAVLAEGQRVLIGDPSRFDAVAVIGVDEHVWRHTHLGDKYVTVVIDLTPVRDKTGPARLLDMLPSRSKQVFKTWLASRTPAWLSRIEVVAMDGFRGFKTAAAEVLPDAVEVMDPFHVVQLAGDALDRCRQRVQQATVGHRGHAGDPLFRIRRVLHAGELLSDRQRERIDAALADTPTSRSRSPGPSISGSWPPTATPTGPPGAERYAP